MVSIMPGIENLRARAHRDEQRVVGIAQPLPHGGLEPLERVALLVLEPAGQPVAVGEVPAAGVGRDGEPGRHGHARVVISARPAPLPPSMSFI